MKKIRHNVLRERISSILGIILFLTTLASVFVVPGITWGDVWMPLGLSLVFILMPDRALGILRRLVDKRVESAAGVLPVLGLLLLSACAASGPATTDAWPYPPLEGRPAYLTPPPAGSTPAQVRKWHRAQRKGMVEASRTVPGKVVARRGSVALATAPSATAAVTAPTTVKASGSATVATAPHSTATNQKDLGKNAAGGVNTASRGTATGAVQPKSVPFTTHLLRGVGIALVGLGVGLLLYAFGWPALRWFFGLLRRRRKEPTTT